MKHIKNLSDFKNTISKNKIVVVDFYTTWCGPCKAISPFFESLENEYTNVVFAKCNCEEAEDVAEEIHLASIPIFIKYENGIEVARVKGADKGKILEFFNGL